MPEAIALTQSICVVRIGVDMFVKTIPWAHVVSPNGWVKIEEGQTLFLADPLPVSPFRGIDTGDHNKTLTTAVVAIHYPNEKERVKMMTGRNMTLRSLLINRTYTVKLVKASESLSPLSYLAHTLYVYCETDGKPSPCDLSVLYALSWPRDMPEYAARVFRDLAVLRVKTGSGDVYKAPEREPTWTVWFKQTEKLMAKSSWAENLRQAIDCLADPGCLKALVETVFDLSPRTRCEAYKYGLWKVRPAACAPADETLNKLVNDFEPGGYTLLAAHALLIIGHWAPSHEFAKYFPLDELLRAP